MKEKFNKTRIPRLQFDILGCLLLNGELTRGELEKKLEKNHTDITKSVSFLLSKELIEPSTRIPSKTRPAQCLQINLKGMQFLTRLHNYDETIFWKILIGYVVHPHKKKLTEVLVREIIEWFLTHYIKYRYHGSNQLGILNELINDIIFNHTEKDNTLFDIQKVMEALAVQGRLTLSQLVKITGCSQITIQKILSMFSLEGFKLTDYELDRNRIQIFPHIFISSRSPEDLIGTKSEDHKGIEKYKSLIAHSLIAISENKHRYKENFYELTLHGVVFVLTIIRYFDRGLLQNGLFYSNFSFRDYFEEIAKKYKELLPLIFGKWKLYTRIKIISTI